MFKYRITKQAGAALLCAERTLGGLHLITMSLISIEISPCKRCYNYVKRLFLHNTSASTEYMEI